MSTQALAVDLKPIETKLFLLRAMANEIQVTDAPSYAAACQIVLDGRAEIKTIGHVLDPGIASAKGHLDTLKNQKQGYVSQVEPIIKTAEQKAEAWKRAEREAAERERQRIQQEQQAAARARAEEERREAERIAKEQREARERELEAQRKAGEIGKREEARLAKQAAEDEAKAMALAANQAAEAAAAVPEVKVETFIPKVAGIKARVNWKFRVVNASKIPALFLMPDEVSIGQEVRRLKDKKKAEEVIPGIEVWSEDGI